MTPRETILHLAAERGSAATTYRGAIRFLRGHIPHPPLAAKLAAQSHAIPGRDRAAALAARYAARADRAADHFGKLAKDTAEQWADELTWGCTSVRNINWMYRTSDSPGSFSFRVKLGEPELINNVCLEWGCYSKSCKWPARNQQITMTVSVRTLQLFPRLEAAGLMVLDAQHLGPREYSMTWLQQARGLSVRQVRGYYLRGRHIIADSLADARQKMRHMRHSAAVAATEERARKTQLRLGEREFRALAAGAWVEIEDSLAVGNCRSASEQVREQVAELSAREQLADAARYSEAGELVSARGDLVLRVRDDAYSRRAITYAARKAS